MYTAINRYFIYFFTSRCDIDEEPEDEDGIMQQSANYSKIVKKQKYVYIFAT